jgi:hypothetical protein
MDTAIFTGYEVSDEKLYPGGDRRCPTFRLLMVNQSSTLITSLLLPGFYRKDSMWWVNFQRKNWVKIQRKFLVE